MKVLDIAALELPPGTSSVGEVGFHKDQQGSQLGFSEDGIP
jgi:hypothetical protein